MMRLTAALLAAALSTAVLASEPAHDDVSYGDLPRATFSVPFLQPDGASAVGSQYDDVQYAPPAERPVAKRSCDVRVAENAACRCRAG